MTPPSTGSRLSRRPILLLLDQPLTGLTPDDRDVLVHVLHDLPESAAVLSTVTTRAEAATLTATISEVGLPGHPAPGQAPVNGVHSDRPSPGRLPW